MHHPAPSAASSPAPPSSAVSAYGPEDEAAHDGCPTMYADPTQAPRTQQ
ncbi:hypothetical protein [Streptomyces jeddahensis]|nr:hypothetical protein [Streptomyces jeddahensis]